MNRPYFRPGRLAWFVTVDGREVRIGKDPRYTSRPKEPPKHLPPALQKKYDLAVQRQGEPEDRTLSFCVETYLASLGDCSQRTVERARHFLGILLAVTGDVRVSKLKPHHVESAYQGRGWKPNTVHAFVTRAHACLNYCVRKDWITRNPVKGKVDTPAVQRREAVMSAEDRQRCLEAAGEPFKSALLFQSGTGCRPIEMRFALVEKCDLDKGVILVRNKTAKKTGTQERPVFLSTQMIDLVRRVKGDRAEGWLFVNSRGGQWTQTAYEHRLEKLCKKLGITHGANLYSFRHAFISDAINVHDMNPALVAIQAGHTDLKMLLKHYLHADHASMRAALDGKK